MDKNLSVWKNLTLTELHDTTPFDQLGGEKYAMQRINEAFEKMGAAQRYDEEYLKKTGNRKFVDFTKTINELSGQIGNNLYKLEHNVMIVGLLSEYDYVDDVLFAACFGRFKRKVECLALNHFDPNVDLLDGKSHMVVLQNNEVLVMSKEEVREHKVNVGVWEKGRYQTTGLQPRNILKFLDKNVTLN